MNNAELSDRENLKYAIAAQRAFVTFNSDDFARLYDDFWRGGREHFGIIVSEQIPIGEMLHRLLRLLDSMTAEEMRNTFRNLGEFK